METKKKFAELNLIDDFLANAVAQSPKYGETFIRMVLSVLLQRKPPHPAGSPLRPVSPPATRSDFQDSDEERAVNATLAQINTD